MTATDAPPLLVVSCDRYADLWEPFFRIFRLRWPDCPFPVHLGTNYKSYEDGAVTTVAIGEDESWASGVLRMLKRLEAPYLIVLLEDFLLTRLLVPGASAWEFEVLGTAISGRLSERFWGVWNDALHYEQGVEKGKWKPAGLRICAEAGVSVDRLAREAFTAEELLAHYECAKHSVKDAEMRRAALNAFRGAHRVTGLRWTARAAGRHPFSLRVWASAACGLVGPTAIDWLESTHLAWRVAAVQRRVPKT